MMDILVFTVQWEEEGWKNHAVEVDKTGGDIMGTIKKHDHQMKLD